MSESLFRLDNQTAVVTGACGKLGPIWAAALLDAGASGAALELGGALVSAAYIGPTIGCAGSTAMSPTGVPSKRRRAASTSKWGLRRFS